MSPARPLAEERLFDPPCLGIPAGSQAGARVCGPDGRFVEIALLVADGRVACAGFLADPSGTCLGPASRWCELAQGRTPESCLEIDAGAVARRRDEPMVVELCLQAGRAAVAVWNEMRGRDPNGQTPFPIRAGRRVPVARGARHGRPTRKPLRGEPAKPGVAATEERPQTDSEMRR